MKYTQPFKRCFKCAQAHTCGISLLAYSCKGPYGVPQPIMSHDPLFPTASSLVECKASCRYSRPGDDTGITVGGLNHEGNCTEIQPARHGMVSLATCQSAASPLRLTGDSPVSRRGGAVSFNPSRCASCEGAREGRGSHRVR